MASALFEAQWSVVVAYLRSHEGRGIGLLSNNPRKARELDALGIVVSAQLPHETTSHAQNHHYLSAKRDRMGHLLDLPPRTALSPEAVS